MLNHKKCFLRKLCAHMRFCAKYHKARYSLSRDTSQFLQRKMVQMVAYATKYNFRRKFPLKTHRLQTKPAPPVQKVVLAFGVLIASTQPKNRSRLRLAAPLSD